MISIGIFSTSKSVFFMKWAFAKNPNSTNFLSNNLSKCQYKVTSSAGHSQEEVRALVCAQVDCAFTNSSHLLARLSIVPTFTHVRYALPI